MRVALYGRHSSTLQNAKSARTQVEALRKDIRSRYSDWVIVETACDEALSGTSLDGRDGLQGLLDLALEPGRPIDAIIVEDASRLFRDQVDAVVVRDRLRSVGVEVLSQADGYIDPGDDSGRLLTAIRDVMAEAQSRETGRKVRRGNVGRVTEGWRPGAPAPFGYERSPQFSDEETDLDGNAKRLGVVLEPVAIQAEAVRFMFKRYAEGAGLKTIARELNDPERPFHAARADGYKPGSIRDNLLNPVYLGWLVYNRTSERMVRGPDGRKRRRKTKNPPSQWEIKEDVHEAIIDNAVWDAVQERFEDNRRKGKGFGADKKRPRGGKAPASLLTGLVRCAACGGNYIVWTSGRNSRQRKAGTGTSQRRFVCNARRSKGTCENSHTFESKALERAVLSALQDGVVTDRGLEYIFERRREYLQAMLNERDDRMAAFRERRALLREQEARLTDAVKKGMLNDTLLAENERIVAEGSRLDVELKGYERLAARRDAKVERHLVRNRMQHLADVLEAPNLDGVRQALVNLIEGVEIRDDGSCWLLVGEGPLGTQDLLLLPGTGTTEGGAAKKEQATGQVPRGNSTRSLVRMVGATGIEPATS